MLKDLGAANGTYVNGKLVGNGAAVTLQAGDIISFGLLHATELHFVASPGSSVNNQKVSGQSMSACNPFKESCCLRRRTVEQNID